MSFFGLGVGLSEGLLMMIEALLRGLIGATNIYHDAGLTATSTQVEMIK